MAHIVSLVNTKGGVGKSTLAVNIAHGLSRRGNHVLIADSDLQASARDWRKHCHLQEREEGIPQVIGVDLEGNLPATISDFADAYDWVIIDGAATRDEKSEKQRGFVLVSDLILIPIGASPLDLWGTRTLVNLIEDRHSMTDGRPVTRYVLSKVRPQTSSSKEIVGVLEARFPVLETMMPLREIYAKSITQASTVYSYEPEYASEARTKEQAVAETEALVNEIEGLVAAAEVLA